MNINSLLDSEPPAAREQTKPRQPDAHHAAHQANQQQRQSPAISRTPSDQSTMQAPYHYQHPPSHPDARSPHYQHQSPPPDHLQRQQPHLQRPHPPTHSPSNHSTGSFHPPPPPLDTRGYAYPTQHSPGLTPHPHHPGGPPHTPSYPYPQRSIASPVQSRNERPYSITPGHSVPPPYGHPAASPSAHPPPRPPLSTHSSASATPSSSSYVQSPMAGRDPSAPQNYPYGNNHRPQPSTPLAPYPPQHPQDRPPLRPDYGQYPLPQHHRTLSNASNPQGYPVQSGSPLPREGPPKSTHEPRTTYSQLPLQTKRPSNEHVPQISERERDMDMSVSPKTQVTTRMLDEQRYAVPESRTSARSSFSEPRPQNIIHGGPPAAISPNQSGHQSSSPASTTQMLHQESRHAQPQPAQDHYHQPQVNERPPPSHSASTETVKRETQPPISSQDHLVLQQPISHLPQAETMKLKRRAESPAAPQEQKKPRVQVTEPPAWARLHPTNPGFDQQIALYPRLKNAPLPSNERNLSQPPGPAAQTPVIGETARVNGKAPTTRDPESAAKKARVSSILGTPWENSITETLPADRLLHRVAEFLYVVMLSNPNLGAGDARNGALEIEAKVGTLVDKNSNDRLKLPVTTPCALHEGFSKSSVRFESFITEMQHKSFNQTLNKWAQSTHEPGRVRSDYAHRYEQDAFSLLSKAGMDALPASAKEHLAKHPPLHPLRLRTTTNVDPKVSGHPVLAQIIKLRLADLDVFCPADQFDVRISVNIEIDLHNRPDLDSGLLSAPPQEGKDRPGDDRHRNKNRLSYRHLTSAIDLTQVTYEGSQEKTHELEVEVDAVALRAQAQLLREGRDNAFEAVVEKFWSDVLLLVRVRDEAVEGGGG